MARVVPSGTPSMVTHMLHLQLSLVAQIHLRSSLEGGCLVAETLKTWRWMVIPLDPSLVSV